MRRITQKEIGRRLNLSVMTVSRALRGASDISEETRRKVLEAAREIRYVPNQLAKSLVTGKSNTIGVLVRSMTTHFYSEFFNYLDDVCYPEGYSVFVTSSEYDAERESRNLRAFLSHGVDALILDRGRPGEHDDLIRQIAGQGVPVVLLGEVDVPDLAYSVVGFDEKGVGGLVAGHLWSLGHRRIMYLSAGKAGDNSLRTHMIRASVFREAWSRGGDGELIRCFETADPMHGGCELAEALTRMSREERPTAVACSTDRLAISLVATLRTHQIRVPEDVSVIGCDDIGAAAEAIVPLTTVRLSSRKMAEGAWRLIQSGLARSRGSSPAERIIIEPELVVRKSTGRREADRQ